MRTPDWIVGVEKRIAKLERDAARIFPKVRKLHYTEYQRRLMARKPERVAARIRADQNRRRWADLVDKNRGAYQQLWRILKALNRPGSGKESLVFFNERERQVIGRLVERQRRFAPKIRRRGKWGKSLTVKARKPNARNTL